MYSPLYYIHPLLYICIAVCGHVYTHFTSKVPFTIYTHSGIVHICVGLLLYMPDMCPHTAIYAVYVSAYDTHARILLYVSACCYICVLILLRTGGGGRPLANRRCYICVLVLLYICVSSYCCYICVLILLYEGGGGRPLANRRCYVCVLVLLYIYVSSYYYVQVEADDLLLTVVAESTFIEP
jgi:hypothetical protein